MMTLSGIYIYPIKSLGGIELEAANITTRGLQYDRRWMIVDEKGDFVTQRDIATMALLTVALTATGLAISHKLKPSLRLAIPFVPTTTNSMTVRVFDDFVTAVEVSQAANDWLSDVLKQKLRLVYMPDTSERKVDTKYIEGHIVSFADGYPILGISEASLEDLNNRLDDPVPMNRFRPNFVFKNAAAFAEDTWSEFMIGKVNFKGVKSCGRCIITTVNQATAQKGKEPLHTLSQYRKVGKKVLFGQSIVPLSSDGRVSIGEQIKIISYKA